MSGMQRPTIYWVMCPDLVGFLNGALTAPNSVQQPDNSVPNLTKSLPVNHEGRTVRLIPRSGQEFDKRSLVGHLLHHFSVKVNRSAGPGVEKSLAGIATKQGIDDIVADSVPLANLIHGADSPMQALQAYLVERSQSQQTGMAKRKSDVYRLDGIDQSIRTINEHPYDLVLLSQVLEATRNLVTRNVNHLLDHDKRLRPERELPSGTLPPSLLGFGVFPSRATAISCGLTESFAQVTRDGIPMVAALGDTLPESQTAKSDNKIVWSDKFVWNGGFQINFCPIKSSENCNQTNLSDKISVGQNRLTQGCQTVLSDIFKGFCLKQGFQTIYWRKLSDKFDANQASKEAWWNQLNCGVHLDAPIQHACSSLIQMLPGLLRQGSEITRPAQTRKKKSLIWLKRD